MLLWKPARPSGGKEPSLENTKKHLEEIVKLLNGLDESEFRADKIKETIWNYAEKEGRGMFFGRCARFDRFGQVAGPFVVAGVLGKEKNNKKTNLCH